MQEINGYVLKDNLTTKNAGFSRWGFCEKNGHEFFIKEFLTPVYPDGPSDLSEALIERKKKVCIAFFQEKRAFYEALQKARTGNLLVALDFFRCGSRYYLVTDKVQANESDPSVIATLSPRKKQIFLVALLYSIARLHEAGLVHADLKPDNIMLKATWRGHYTPKIIDFDAGFPINDVPKEISGDFVYLAPEVYLKMNEEEAEINEKLDVFALGILIHQYWTGTLPEIGDDYQYVFEAVLDGQEIGLSDGLPDYLRSIVKETLCLDPRYRPSVQSIFERVQREMGSFGTAGSAIESSNQKNRQKGFYIPHDLD